MMKQITIEELMLQTDSAEWSCLRIHHTRDALIVVGGVDLARAGLAIATDDAAAVASWIKEGVLCKPTAAQLAEWDSCPAKSFRFLIVQPYVLIADPQP